MQKQYFKAYSPSLGRDMEGTIYGHAGRPMLFIPCQDGHHPDFEGFHMTETLAPWIESGQIQVTSIDTLDKETWSDKNGDPYFRARRHEAWMSYIFNEIAPSMIARAEAINGPHADNHIISFGCSLGATHAVNCYLRRPDLFSGMMALSGIYTGTFGWGSYSDEVVYANSPVDYMANLPRDHYYVDLFNRQRAVICVGQGAWEEPATTFQLKNIFAEKGIDIWVDAWGYDVNHDWPWWHKQVPYFMPYLQGK